MLNSYLRPKTDADLHFIVDAWVKSVNFPPPFFKTVREIALDCLVKNETIVACNPEDHDQIFGFVNYTKLDNAYVVLNYMYVKQTFQKLGLGYRMYQALPMEESSRLMITFFSPMFYRFSKKHNFRYLFNPYFFMKE